MNRDRDATKYDTKKQEKFNLLRLLQVILGAQCGLTRSSLNKSKLQQSDCRNIQEVENYPLNQITNIKLRKK